MFALTRLTVVPLASDLVRQVAERAIVAVPGPWRVRISEVGPRHASGPMASDVGQWLAALVMPLGAGRSATP